ncbi:DUF2975 domain-containing protein [Atopococcus tabaci]|uniref:DUF2975 domain-containing protein n=1 Tax=Atopococcus tabaci TaxID=269774 RepID=UPI002409F2D5|nr:DUF2975 domain-containing protein [Atopococcus tabaci]
MKKSSTIFLRIVVFLIGILVLGICIFALPVIARVMSEIAAELHPAWAHIRYPLLIGLYGSAAAFFYALYQTLKLLGYIDKNMAFSNLSVKALKHIKYSALTYSGLFVLMSPLFLVAAEADDAPGFLAIVLILSFASFVIAVFAAVLEKVLQDAVRIKSENDLTV